MAIERLGHYRLPERIGAGGMGEVYRARDERLDREVAIRILPLNFRDDMRARDRLLEEARSASQLNHSHICTIYEVNQAESIAFIAMEYVAGRPLSAIIPPESLPTDEVVRYGTQIAEALAHAHQRRIVHRDLKPTNGGCEGAGLWLGGEAPHRRLKAVTFEKAPYLRRSLGGCAPCLSQIEM